MPLVATPSRSVSLLAVPLAILALGACWSGDAVADGGTDGTECPVGQVTFVLRGTSGAPGQYCVGGPSSCSDEWLAIVRPDTSALEIDRRCEADCSVCEPMGCPALCAAPTALHAGGAQRTWDGSGYLESHCGAALACVAPACAPRGRYTAKMCAYAAMSSAGDAGLCSPVAAPTCVSVAFDWPPDGGQATVTGTIGRGADGGSLCCPAGFTPYACTYPDGGAGQACHNPALGCASSTTCGAACDPIVSGRCDAS